MHFAVLVVVGRDRLTRDTIEEVVGPLLAPHQDTEWDWWQVGGRWTGELSGYNPEKDPANVVDCTFCKRTGQRTDLGPTPVTCNVCKGTGRHVVWPTSFAAHEGDVARVGDIGPMFVPYAFVTPDGAWRDGAEWETARAEFSDHYAVIVDCHN